MNLIRLKRFVRSNRYTRKMVDGIYAILTGQYREKKHIVSRNGEIYYVIRPPYAANGLGGLYLFVLGHMEYAYSKGYIPVVDFDHGKTVYSGDEVSGSQNVWEWYFLQPGGVSLKKAFSGNYILARTAPRQAGDLFIQLMRGNKDIVGQYFNIGGGITLADSVEKHIEKTKEELFPVGEKVLGVFYRGTDYVQLKPCGHPVQPEIGSLVAMVKERLSEWGNDKIFLLTEEKNTMLLFEKEFPGMVISTHQNLVENYSVDSGLLIEDYKTKQFGNRYVSGLEYLTGIVLLASCDSFIGAIAGGSATALMMNGGKYTHCQVIDLGVY